MIDAASESRIRALIAQAEQWRLVHRVAHRQIEATCAEIRVQALYDALGERRPKVQR